MKSMKVLNIAQPNAHHVFHYGKNVENRSQPVNFRGTIAIYASKTIKNERFENQTNGCRTEKKDCSYGAIIGFIDLIDCITESNMKTKKWHQPNYYGYVLENPRILTNPIFVDPPKGAVTWWNLTGKELDDCLIQLKTSDFVSIVEVDPIPEKKRPKGNKNEKFLASDDLSLVVGKKPVTFSVAVKKVFNYIEHNADYVDHYVVSDSVLLNIFKKKKFKVETDKDLDYITDKIKENLRAS